MKIERGLKMKFNFKKTFPFIEVSKKPERLRPMLSVRKGVVYLDIYDSHHPFDDNRFEYYNTEDAVVEQGRRIEIGRIEDMDNALKILHAIHAVEEKNRGIALSADVKGKSMEAAVGKKGMFTKAFYDFTDVMEKVRDRGDDWINGVVIHPFMDGWDESAWDK